jgi:hypothetical protein
MSDYRGASGSGPEMGATGEPTRRGRGLPVWVMIAIALAAAAIAATGVALATRSARDEQTALLAASERDLADLTARMDALSAAASRMPTVPAAPATVAPTPPAPAPAPAPAPPATSKEWAFLTGGSASGGKLYIKADYIYFYSGAEAVAERAAHGGSLRPDGTYVRNTSSKIVTLRLLPTAKVRLVEWLETGTPGSSWKLGAADPNAFVAVLMGTASSPSGVWSKADKVVLLTVTGSNVSEVLQYTAGP